MPCHACPASSMPPYAPYATCSSIAKAACTSEWATDTLPHQAPCGALCTCARVLFAASLDANRVGVNPCMRTGGAAAGGRGAAPEHKAAVPQPQGQPQCGGEHGQGTQSATNSYLIRAVLVGAQPQGVCRMSTCALRHHEITCTSVVWIERSGVGIGAA